MILPVTNSARVGSSNIDNDSSLVEILPIFSPNHASPETGNSVPENASTASLLCPHADSSQNNNDQELHCAERNVDVVPSQLQPEASTDDVITKSTFVIEEFVPQIILPVVEGGIMKVLNSTEGEEEERQEKEVVSLKRSLAVDEGRWIKHYCSLHRILLVGEGDFSFSACLAKAFGMAPNMVATSLDNRAFLESNYENAVSNIEELKRRECWVVHEVDATEMSNDVWLRHLKFDRIIYNFPYAGYGSLMKSLSRQEQLLRHRTLVSGFMKNAVKMMKENGEIHITHKTNGFHQEWNLESIAASLGLMLNEAVEFSLEDYPGYETKYGFGGDENFYCCPSKTYNFGLERASLYDGDYLL